MPFICQEGIVNASERDARIRGFHTRALALLDADDGNGARRQEIADLLQELASTPGILPDVALERLHDAGSTATILHQGEDGHGALMLLRLPDTAPTPVHNHHTWGVAAVISGRNRYWRWERHGDLGDPDHADLRLAEVFDHGPGHAVLWDDPPHDWHAQQGLDGDAYEFVFFGRNPNLQPRAYFDPETGAITYAMAANAMDQTTTP